MLTDADPDPCAGAASGQGIATPSTPADDAWTRHARPTFLYAMYLLILWAIPIGFLALIRPSLALAVGDAMTRYLAAIPDSLYTLFGTGYVGYTVARQWGKMRGGSDGSTPR